MYVRTELVRPVISPLKIYNSMLLVIGRLPGVYSNIPAGASQLAHRQHQANTLPPTSKLLLSLRDANKVKSEWDKLITKHITVSVCDILL